MGVKRQANYRKPGAQTEALVLAPQWRNALSLLLILLLVLAIAAGLTRLIRQALNSPDLWPLHKVVSDTENLQQVARADLDAAVAFFYRQSFPLINLDEVREAVLTVAWIKSVRVRRVWPNRLHLHITEHQALARRQEDAEKNFCAAGLCSLVDSRGTVFQVPRESVPEGLPLFQSPAGHEAEVSDFYQKILPVLHKAGMNLQTLRYNKRGAWQIILADGVALLLGKNPEINKLRRFTAVYPHILQRRAHQLVHYVDLRYTNGIAVQWGNPAAG